jgi:hypothetical protein
MRDERYPMSEGHDAGEEPVLTGYVSSLIVKTLSKEMRDCSNPTTVEV